MANWFDVDKEGLSKVLQRRGKSWMLAGSPSYCRMHGMRQACRRSGFL